VLRNRHHASKNRRVGGRSKRSRRRKAHRTDVINILNTNVAMWRYSSSYGIHRTELIAEPVNTGRGHYPHKPCIYLPLSLELCTTNIILVILIWQLPRAHGVVGYHAPLAWERCPVQFRMCPTYRQRGVCRPPAWRRFYLTVANKPCPTWIFPSLNALVK
jgi:hypothetical protein